jgi:hypothetical protein
MNAKVSKAPLTKEELQKVKEVIDGLEKDPQAYDFLEPVDFVGKYIYDLINILFLIRTWIR